MKKIYSKLIMATAIALMATACGDKDYVSVDPHWMLSTDGTSSDDDIEVTITTADIQTKSAVLQFGSDAKMNIFAKSFNRIDAPNIVDNVVATFDGNAWTMSPKVYINSTYKNAFIYAVAPFDAAYTDPQAIPVDLAKQVDLMYSGDFVPASRKTSTVSLKMNHALSLLTFNILPVGYTGAGNLTSLAINGDLIYCKGVMDASKGRITPTDKGEVKASFSKTVQAGGWKSDIPGLWTLPFNTKAGSVTLSATIDGKTFETVIPEVEVKQGWQYIFRLVLTSGGLEIDPSKTETISLNVNTDETPDFKDHGKISIEISGSWINSPEITGDAVFGTLSSPSASKSYNGTQKVEGLKAGDVVTVEVWNADGFYIPSLDGVSTIDISDFE